MAQSAVGFIRQGTAMLHAGRMELENAKSTIETALTDVKAIKGIFDWFIGLFKAKPQPDAPKPVAQKKVKSTAKQQSYEEIGRAHV